MVDPRCKECFPEICVHGEQSPSAEEVAAGDQLFVRSKGKSTGVEVFRRPLARARHLVDQSTWSLKVLREQCRERGQFETANTLDQIVGNLQRSERELDNHEGDLGLACHALGGAR